METLKLVIGSETNNVIVDGYVCKRNNNIVDAYICKHNRSILQPDDCYLCIIEGKYHIDIDNSKYRHIGIEHRNGKDIITLEPW
jgi:hypothetical protein